MKMRALSYEPFARAFEHAADVQNICRNMSTGTALIHDELRLHVCEHSSAVRRSSHKSNRRMASIHDELRLRVGEDCLYR